MLKSIISSSKYLHFVLVQSSNNLTLSDNMVWYWLQHSCY